MPYKGSPKLNRMGAYLPSPKKPTRKNVSSPAYYDYYNNPQPSSEDDEGSKVQNPRLKFQISRQIAAPPSEGPTSFSSSPLLQEVRLKQSHFFNSLFPSRANRFGYPVYPERQLGIPSDSGPVSFAGFGPSSLTSGAREVPAGPASLFAPEGRASATALASAQEVERKKSKKRPFFKNLFSH